MLGSFSSFVNLFDVPRSWRCYLGAAALIALGLATGHAADPDNGATERSEWHAASTNGVFNVTLGPRSGQVSLGKFQVWELRLTTADGELVFPARFAIGGGMQGHGHGLPTQPRVSGFLPDGRYVIEGMKFNMAGDWTLFLAIEAEVGTEKTLQSDQVQVDIVVDY